MANEFRIKHGLIVTGSSYFSESMFAPNLPEETAPNYYITWRQSDGRFEVTEVSPTTVATTAGCWDFAEDPGAGKWYSDNEAIGNTTSTITINITDNSTNNQSTLLSSIGKGSIITLYIGSYVTSFEVTGITVINAGSPAQPFRYDFAVNYVSGDQYSITGNPEMCLEVAASAPSNQNCLNFTMDGGFQVGTGEASFLLDTGTTQSVGTTINSDIASLILNNTANSSKNTLTFFQGINPGSFISISQGTYIAHFKYLGLGKSTTFVTVNVDFTPGQSGTTFTVGKTIDICISPGI